MRLVRDFERRLEHLVEGVAGRVFRGPLHPVELAARLVREADLALTKTPVGPAAPNAFVLRIHPKDLGDAQLPVALTGELTDMFESTAADRGWRLEGPVDVRIEQGEEVTPGTVDCRVETVVGSLPAWAALIDYAGTRFPLRHNRSLIGRGAGVDVAFTEPEVSRQHAMLWRESGGVWLTDLGSANGTSVDGVAIHTTARIDSGTVVSFGPVKLTFRY